MAELTPQQADKFRRVSAWASALLRLRKEIAEMDKEITRLQNRKTSREAQATRLDTRIQDALASVVGGGS